MPARLGWVAELLQYLEEPGEQHTWRHHAFGCAHPLRVVLGRRVGERYEARSCTLTHACRTLQYIQDEEHVLFRCQHPTFCALRGFYEYLFDVRVSSCLAIKSACVEVKWLHEKAKAEKRLLTVHVFMNRRGVKFVQRLQLAVWDLGGTYKQLKDLSCF